MSFFPHALAAPAPAPGLSIEWEEPNCLLCGGRRWSCLVEAPDTSAGGKGLWFAVVQCQECGLCFTNPRPSLNSIGQFYPEGAYRPYRPVKRVHSFAASWRWRFPGKERQEMPWHGDGRLLDFGCGGGSFLERMKQ